MLSKNKIKFLNSLKLKKFRDENQQFIAEGDKLVRDLLSGNFQIHEIFATHKWLDNNTLPSNNIIVNEINEDELSKISQLSTPNQVLAVAKYQKKEINYFEIFNNLTLMLDEIKDPGNMGTIIRIADWFGISNIICSEDTVDTYNPKVVQSTMGSIARVNIYYTNLAELLKKTPENTPVYGTLLTGENIYEQNLSKNGIIIVGNESRGISDDLQQYITHKLLIPSYAQNADNKAESLNASVATAIICAEFKRKFN
jgi:TrmH family RNA methyltransferase